HPTAPTHRRRPRRVHGGGPRTGPPHPPAFVAPRGTRGAPRSRAPHPPHARRAPAKPWRASITGRWLKSHYLVGPRGGLAEASHRVSGQPRVDLVQAQVDLAVGEREEA